MGFQVEIKKYVEFIYYDIGGQFGGSIERDGSSSVNRYLAILKL